MQLGERDLMSHPNFVLRGGKGEGQAKGQKPSNIMPSKTSKQINTKGKGNKVSIKENHANNKWTKNQYNVLCLQRNFGGHDLD